jgi:hypothetical protein
MNERWAAARLLIVFILGAVFIAVMAFGVGFIMAGSYSEDIAVARQVRGDDWLETPEREKLTSFFTRLRPGQAQVVEAGWSCEDQTRPMYIRPRAGELEMSGQNWRCAILRRANLAGVYLQDSQLDGATMRKVNFAEATLQDVSAFGASLQRARFTHARLQRVSFAGASLRRSNWVGAQLDHVSFVGADLRGSDLCGVSGLERADLNGARLAGARCPDGSLIPRLNFGAQDECADLMHPAPLDLCRGSHDDMDEE